MDALWLKETVGEPLSSGLAEIAKFQPEDSIDYLGRYLLKYVEVKEGELRRKQLGAQAKTIQTETDLRQKHTEQKEEESKQSLKEAETELEQNIAEYSQSCSREFDEAEFGANSALGLADALNKDLMDKYDKVIEGTIKATGASTVYIGKVSGSDEDKRFEIIASNDKTIIGESVTNVKNDEGIDMYPFEVTERVEEEVDEEEQEESEETEDKQEEEQNEASEIPVKLPNHTYVSNVLKDSRVPFFGRVPLLGSFLSVCVPFEDSMHDEAIPEDGGLIEEDVEAGEEGEAAENPENPKPKSWMANKTDGFLVVCVDTMGNGKELTEGEIDVARKHALALSSGQTGSSDVMYQAEMAHRETLTEKNEINTVTLTEAIAKSEEDVAEAVEKIGTENEEMTDEEKEWKGALAKLDVYKNNIINEDWWLSHIKDHRKICIHNSNEFLNAMLLFLKIYPIDAKNDWQTAVLDEDWKTIVKLKRTIKEIDLDELAASVRNISSETESISAEQATDLLTQIEGLGDTSAICEKPGAWAAALAVFTNTALEAIIANDKYNTYLKEKAAAEEAEAAAAAAAAAEEEEANE